MHRIRKAATRPRVLLLACAFLAAWIVVLPALRAQMGSTVQFSSTSYTVNENAGTAVITVTLTPASSATVTVNYTTANGSAVAPGDYQSTSGQLTFNPGETSKTFSVTTVDDSTPESDEMFGVMLSTPINATLGTPSAAPVTIKDNDTPPPPSATVAFTMSSYTVNEGDGTATISVMMTGTPTSPVTVNYSTSDGTAKSGSDYAATSGQLTWQPSEAGKAKTFTITILDDSIVETMESLNVTLSNPSSNAVLGTPSTTMVSIMDDDQTCP